MLSVLCGKMKLIYPVIQLSQQEVLIYKFLYLETFDIPLNPPLLRVVRKKSRSIAVRMLWGWNLKSPLTRGMSRLAEPVEAK